MTSAYPTRIPDDADQLVALLAQTAQGDADAFSAFYHLTSRRVHGLARRIIVDADISQDTTQEVFLMVWEQADRYDPRSGSPLSWLMTITHRRAVDRVRTQSRSSRRELTWGLKASPTAYDEVAEAAADHMEARDVVRCLKSLTALQRQSIHLAFYGCLTYREVAAHLEVPLPTVKTRIRDGLRQLRACLDAS